MRLDTLRRPTVVLFGEGSSCEVEIAAVRIDPKAFSLRRIGPVVLPEHSALGEELKAKIRADLRALEPKVKDRANRLIGEGVVDGKGLRSAGVGK